MAMVGLKAAAEMTGKAQVTIHRAMKAGRLSFTIGNTGDRLIDTSELDRVFNIKKPDVITLKAPNEISCNDVKSDVMTTDVQVLATEKRFLEDKIRILEDIAYKLQEDKADLIRQRDKWQCEAEHYKLLSAPASQSILDQPAEAPRSGFWRRLFG